MLIRCVANSVDIEHVRTAYTKNTCLQETLDKLGRYADYAIGNSTYLDFTNSMPRKFNS